ncbi:MAG: L-threonine 3-dehydrogenase [Pseudomonadota bacterium]
MRALVKAEAAPGLVMQRVPVPDLGPNDVRIRVETSAICGTDLHIWNWDAWAAKTVPVPMVVGHEYVGRVEAVGAAVTRFHVGERVTSEGHIVCGRCRNCRAGREHLCRETVGVGVNRPGSFAEFLSVPEHNVYPVPNEVPDAVAAILDPFGNAVHTALSFDLVGEDVLITGAGPIGVMAAAICRHVGARHVVVTDLNDYRLSLAAKMGASRVVNVGDEDLRSVMADLGMTEGFDVALEMSGAGPAFRQIFEVMNNGGKIALLGIPPAEMSVDWNSVIFKGLTLKGIYGREMFDAWYKGLSMLQSGLTIEPVLTHRFAIDDFARGFESMAQGSCGKVVLDWK